MKPRDIPDYLKKPTQSGYKYGTLALKKGHFILTGEPVMMEFAKRVFPGASTSRAYGKTKRLEFSKSAREFSDLCWLMMRFPLELECEEEFEKYRVDAISRWRVRVAGDDTQPTTPPEVFIGDLYPYQKSAVTFLTTNRRALLGDSMGMGKTWSALGAVAQTQKYPVLVVCQTQIQLQWQRAIGALFKMDCEYQTDIGDTEFDVSQKRGRALATILKGRTPYELPNTPFTIIHYGLLAWWDKALRRRGYPVVIFDEVQELRHTGTHKYSAASLLSGDAEHVYGLSGSPVYGYGAEIWSVTNALDYHCLGGFEAFTREWCSGYGSKIVEEPRALNGHLVREGLMLRRKYETVMPEMPPVVRTVVDVDQDDELYADLIASAKQKAKAWTTASFTAKGKLSREIERETRQAAGIAKASFVGDFVAGLIEGGERPLVYAWHHAVHDILNECLAPYGVVSVTGRQTQKQKDDAIRTFIKGGGRCGDYQLAVCGRNRRTSESRNMLCFR